jgi:hypothetical protein
MFENDQISQEKEKLRRLVSPIGLVSGTIGPFVGRIYPLHKNGKIVYQQRFATLPKQYKTNRRQDLQDNRFRFRTTALFAKEIIAHPQLKKLWTIAAKGKSTAYNYINKINYPLTYPVAPSEKNLIIPDNTKLQVKNLKLTPYAISGEIAYKKNSTLIAFLSFSEPSDDNGQKFRIISVSIPVTSDTFIIPVSKEIKENSLLYTKFTLFITIITENGKRISSSGTFTTSGTCTLFVLIPLTAKSSIRQNQGSLYFILPKAPADRRILSYYNTHKPRSDTSPLSLSYKYSSTSPRSSPPAQKIILNR